MSRFTVSVPRLASFFTLAFGLASTPFCTPAAQAQLAKLPQPIPYTVTALAGGGTMGTTFSTTTVPAKPFAVNQSCGNNSLKATDVFGDGCLATQVALPTVHAAAVDSQGNLFLLDSNNQLIRRVDAQTGIITLIAGTGSTGSNPSAGSACPGNGATAGLNGDNCPANMTYLADPEALIVDKSGNLWFTDYLLGSVREVVKTTGVITTIVNTTGNVGYMAGNIANPGVVVPATQGLLYRPYGLSFDPKGNLYIAGNYNSTLDMVNLTGAAEIVFPAAATPINLPAGAIYTIAGSGCAYTTTTYCKSNYGTGGAGGPSTSALLDSPYQVAVDNSGNIYIADEFPYDVRVINGSTGIINTFANSTFKKLTNGVIVRGPAATTNLANIYGVAADSYGNVYIDTYDSATTSASGYIARVDIANAGLYVVAGQHTTANSTTPDTAQPGATYCAAATDPVGDGCPATQASFLRPYFPIVDAAGNLYITDQGNGLIRKVSVGTQFPATTATAPITQTVDLHFASGDTLATVTLPNGSPDFTLGTPACAAANSVDGTVDCLLTVTFTPAAAGARRSALTVKSAAGLLNQLALTGTGVLPLLSLDPGTQSTLASTNVTGVTSLTVDNSSNVYVTVPTVASVLKVSATGAQSSIGSGLTGANSVAVDGAGNTFVALASGSIAEITASGTQTTFATGFSNPAGLAADAIGNLYIADSAANTVSEILAGSGLQITLANTTSVPSLSGPTGLAVDTLGNLFLANTAGNTVIELPFNGSGAITLGSGLSAPAAVTVDPAGSLYIADSRNHRIVFIPNESGTLNTADQITTISGLSSPSGVRITGTGTVYVADSVANALYSYTRTAAAINFGNDSLGNAVSAPADIISGGNAQPAFNTPFTAAAGNTGDFTLNPSAIPSSSGFPAPGFGIALLAGFNPTTTGPRSATYTFGGSGAQLLLTGNGINPVDKTTTTIMASPTNGTYGQTVNLTITVSAAPGLPTPTGTVTVTYDSTASTLTLSPTGVATLAVSGLSAGAHTVTAAYTGDPLSSPSNAAPVMVTLAKAPLTIAVNNLTKVFSAPLPTLTGVVTGIVNNDTIPVSYSTPANASSPLGSYPITATYTGSAAANYNITITPGVLSVVKASSVVTLSSSATNVNASTQVVLTAMVTGQAASASAPSPSGMVTFLSGSTPLGTTNLNAAGVATLTTTFAVTGTASNYAVTAVYLGDSNFGSSTSAPLAILAGTPTFTLTPATSSLNVAQGQSGLTSFLLTPNYRFTGLVNFSCTGQPATVTCLFSPTSITEDGTNSPATIALSLTTVQPGPLASLQPPTPHSNVLFAAIPGLALLLGMAGRRRKLFRATNLFVLTLLCLLGLSLSGCGAGRSTAGTATGPYTISVVASGAGSVTQQFNVSLTVH